MVNWDNAPDWAMWHAFDKNGDGWWFEKKPFPSEIAWYLHHEGRAECNIRQEVKSTFITWRDSLTRRQPTQAAKKHSHYHKDVSSLNSIDVYRVLALWDVKDHAIGHAIKKLLNAGQRGSKSLEQDLQEAIDSIQRKLDMIGEDNSD